MKNIKDLHKIKQECLKTLLGLYKTANAGHIACSLSCMDLLIHLYFEEMKPTDKFILSKGHAAAGLYTVLNKKKLISDELLKTFYQEGTLLAAHPPCTRQIEHIIFGTGSLGHGLSLATGLAFSNRFTKKNFNVYSILSDGECNEGSTWEAALFAGHHKLSNLNIIIDKNGLQGFGTTKEVIDLEHFEEKWQSFGFETFVIENGNNLASIASTFSQSKKQPKSKPRCYIANTTKGSGISFMENKLEWHYLPMSDEQYRQALQDVVNLHA